MNIDTIALWPFREEIYKGLDGYLSSIVNAGFSSVELAGFARRPPQETADLVSSFGLSVASMHCPTIDLDKHTADVSENLSRWISTYSGMFQCDTFVISSTLKGDGTGAQLDLLAEIVHRLLDRTSISKLLYHGYYHDYVKRDDERWFRRLARTFCRDGRFGMQLDSYWLHASGFEELEDIQIQVAPDNQLAPVAADLIHLTPHLAVSQKKTVVNDGVYRSTIDFLCELYGDDARFIMEPITEAGFKPLNLGGTMKLLKGQYV